jgi:uncharacterized membrane protein SpoIIM required for sporulation
VDLDAYIAENVQQWRRLERLTSSGRLSVAEVDELTALYQRTGTQLSVLRSKSPDPLLVAWLSRVLMGARARLTGAGPARWRAVVTFFTDGFPLAVYQARRWWVTVGLLFVAGSGGFITYIADNPDVRDRLLPSGYARQLVEHDFADYYTQAPAQHFALKVWTNNANVTGQCLAAGVLIVPVLLLLYTTMRDVGVDGGFMIANGRGDQFFGLILPHGMLELTAMFIAAGVGLRIGWSWIAPAAGLTRARSLASAARAAMLAALGLVLVLAVSGILEAYVTPSALPTWARIGVGAALWCVFIGYVFVFGRAAQERRASADLDAEFLAAYRPTV